MVATQTHRQADKLTVIERMRERGRIWKEEERGSRRRPIGGS